MKDKRRLQRKIKILEEYYKGKNKSEIAMSLDLSRERVGAIIESLTGLRDPDVSEIESSDFSTLGELRMLLGISFSELAEKTGRGEVQVRNLFYYPDRFTNVNQTEAFKEFLRVITERLDAVAELLESLK